MESAQDGSIDAIDDYEDDEFEAEEPTPSKSRNCEDERSHPADP